MMLQNVLCMQIFRSYRCTETGNRRGFRELWDGGIRIREQMLSTFLALQIRHVRKNGLVGADEGGCFTARLLHTETRHQEQAGRQRLAVLMISDFQHRLSALI